MHQFNVKLFRGTHYPQLKRNNCVVGNSLGHDLMVKNGKFLSPKNTTSVEGLGPCLQFFLWTPVKVFNSHSAPELESVPDVRKRILENAVKLRDDIKNKTREIIAFITGGMEYDPKLPITSKCNDCINDVYEALQEEGIDTVVIALQKGNGLKNRINTYARENTITCQGGPIRNIPKLDKNTKKEDLIEALEEHFDFVELPPNVKVEVVDELPAKTQHLL